jgi:ABC-type glycerol-3-phosphate transport system substrate-binding protein
MPIRSDVEERTNTMRTVTTARAGVVLAVLALATSLAPAASAQSEGDWGNIDWRQFEGTTLNVLATAMPVSEVYAPAIAGFEDLTGIKVNFTQLNDTDRKNAQLVDFQGGTGEYCVSNVGISNREEFVTGDYLEPLQPYLDDPALTDAAWYDIGDYAPGIIAGGYSDADPENGTLVYLPFTAEYFLLWYRKDIFDQLGLGAPRTVEELRTVAEALDAARQEGTIGQYAWTDRAQPGAGEGGWNLFTTANRMGAQWVDFPSKTSYLLQPGPLEVMTFYTDMIKDFGPPGSGNWTWPDISKAFSQGQLAMTVAGNASYTVLENPETSTVAGMVGYAPPPLVEGGLDPLWEWGWAINADCRDKGAAWLFTQWATSPTLMRQISPLFGVPARTSIYSDPDYLAAMPSEEFVQSQAWMLANGVDPRAGMTMSADYGLVADIISAEMNAVVAGQQSAEDAVKNANTNLEKEGYTAG